MAAAVGASAVELWTDVDGVMSADPRLVSDARPIRRLRYDELMELSHFGAKVVHPPSVHPVRACGIPLWIKSTFHPNSAGTLVSDEPDEGVTEDCPVRGITSIHRVAMARLEGDGMVGVPGVAMRLFGALARRGVSVILITQGSSEHSICFAVAPEDLEAARQTVGAEFEVDRRAGDIDELNVEDDVAVVAVVGAAMCQRPGIAGRLFSILGERGINVRAIAQGSSELNISLVVRSDDEAHAVQAIHQAFFERPVPTASLFLAGVGGVGGALLEQLAEERPGIGKATPRRLRLDGIANSTAALIDTSGIEPQAARDRLRAERGAGRSSELIEAAVASHSPVRIFVDCTASDDMAEAYGRLLAGGVTVVTANKKVLAGEMDQFRLADLLATGDDLIRVEGVLSGTASFLTGELARGEPFSATVGRARELGYTEPDPREDLAGEDVARKLLILARMAGAELERSDLAVEPWIPAEPWAAMAPEEFTRRLPELDPEFGRRQKAAAGAGSRLAYLASWNGSRARVALVEIAPEHPCFDLAPGENLIAFHTRRYAEMPLVVRGPGAGPRVTAAGVFADILRALAEKGKWP
jgi:aspartokinase/homoserine dehydrogenase 1